MRDNTVPPRLVVVTSCGRVGRDVLVVLGTVVGISVVVVTGEVCVLCVVGAGVFVVVVVDEVVVVVGSVVVVVCNIVVVGGGGNVVILRLVVVSGSSSLVSVIDGLLMTSSRSALTTVATPKALLSFVQVNSIKTKHFNYIKLLFIVNFEKYIFIAFHSTRVLQFNQWDCVVVGFNILKIFAMIRLVNL